MEPLYIILITTASAVTALTVIFTFGQKLWSSTRNRIRIEAREVAAEEANKERIMREADMELNRQRTEAHFDEINNKLDKITKAIEAQGKEQYKMNKLLKDGHIETWKNDIRTIYYNLRDTGNISDIEKSYVDKIYHLYKEMGGNSDIDAKYKEMVEVYTKRTREKYDEVFEKRRGRPRKKQANEIEE